MSLLLSLIPAPYRIAALALLAVALVGFGWVKGAEHGQHRIDAMVGKAATEGVRIARARDVVTTRVETRYLPQITRTQVVTETILKEVPVYVPIDAPDLPGGFRLLTDAAAAGRIPDPAGLADAAPVPVADVARTTVENYGTCRADAIRLQGLQEWVIEQGKVR